MSRRNQKVDRQPHFIRQWCLARQTSSKQVAESVGLSKATISRIETRNQPYTQNTLEAIAFVLGQPRTRSRFRVSAKLPAGSTS